MTTFILIAAGILVLLYYLNLSISLKKYNNHGN